MSEEDAAITPSAVIERDRDTTVQSSILAPKQSYGSNIESTFTQSFPVIQAISSPLPESIPMDQDFQIPIIEEVVFPSEGAQASGSSSETPELIIFKGKRKFSEFEFMDVALLQSRVFDLEQRSAEKDFIIGNERAIRSAPDANLYSFLSSGLVTTQERRENQIRVDQLKGKMLVMKHSDQNCPGEHHEMFFRETGKKFTDKYGDRFGIFMWGYDTEKKMWTVKRKSGRI
ncbi:unnamed protein product [Lactuca saligna]|uniref:Uncharacterized protein n=1 Tax=Lactuca saligna TaxID=75948 RepID=A0AA35YY21_LACSI|nr:unnamed protein product [Lactuca saligna]